MMGVVRWRVPLRWRKAVVCIATILVSCVAAGWFSGRGGAYFSDAWAVLTQSAPRELSDAQVGAPSTVTPGPWDVVKDTQAAGDPKAALPSRSLSPPPGFTLDDLIPIRSPAVLLSSALKGLALGLLLSASALLVGSCRGRNAVALAFSRLNRSLLAVGGRVSRFVVRDWRFIACFLLALYVGLALVRLIDRTNICVGRFC
jgi:hypothetical protein